MFFQRETCFSKVLVDNESVVNAMPLKMLTSLGRNIDDLIEA